MKKRIISLICICLIFSILCINASAAIPEDETMQPRWTYIQGTSAAASLNGNSVTYSAWVKAYDDIVESTSIAVYLQYRTAGSSDSWTTIYLKTGTGDSFCYVSGSKSILSGYEYRIKAVCTAYGSSGSETTTAYSNIV